MFAVNRGVNFVFFSKMAALLADVDSDVFHAMAAMGRSIGTAGQLISDCYDLYSNKYDCDLASGILTLPIVFHVEGLDSSGKDAFKNDLIRAESDSSVRDDIGQCVAHSGALRRVYHTINSCRDDALSALSSVGLSDAREAYLKKIILSKCQHQI